MSTVTILIAMVAGLFAVLAWLAIWSRRASAMRHVAIGLFLLGLPMLAGAGLESLSWSRPLWAMWELHGEVRVLAAKMIEGEAIYLYIDMGEGEPRSVAIPWDARKAKQLQDLFDAPGNQGQAMMKYEWSWERRKPLQFYDLPQPPILMPKVPEPQAPHFEL